MLRRRDFLSASSACLIPGGTETRGSNPKARACILLLLVGGPSQIDTWDPKPESPREVRSPWRAIRTNVPGVWITELFPRMARVAHRYALVRSVYHDGPPDHETGHQLLHTGFLEADAVGPTLACATGSAAVLPCRLGNTGGGHHGNGQAGLPVTDLRACGLEQEPEKLRDRYGRNRFGQSCLAARRLVEAGTRFVTVNMFDTVFDEITWDCHGAKPFSGLRDYPAIACPFDTAWTALLEDLASRGMLESTLVVASGEFGRTPRINPVGGRDHSSRCWTALISGAGVRGGQVYGCSDETSSEPRENPVHASQLVATMASKLGINWSGAKPLPL